VTDEIRWEYTVVTLDNCGYQTVILKTDDFDMADVCYAFWCRERPVDGVRLLRRPISVWQKMKEFERDPAS
jgi:hypothetical protein